MHLKVLATPCGPFGLGYLSLAIVLSYSVMFNKVLAQSFQDGETPPKDVSMQKRIYILNNYEPGTEERAQEPMSKKGFRANKINRNDAPHYGKRDADFNRKWLLLATTGDDNSASQTRSGEQWRLKESKSQRPILTSEELATQLRDDPRLAKAIVDTWIDTNNDGVITGSEILGRK